MSVLFTLYYYFDEEELEKTIKSAPGSSEKEMAEVLVPYALDVLRTLIGRMPWRLMNEERFKFTQVALSRLIPLEAGHKCYKLKSGQKKNDETGLFTYKYLPHPALSKEELHMSPFVQFGLKNVALAVEDINFTDVELQKAISAPEKARLTAVATKLEADGDCYKIREEGKAEAEARKEMLETIAKHKDLEALFSLREMAKSESTTFYQLPHIFETKLAGMLDGKKSSRDLFNMDEDEKLIFLKMFEETIKKMKGGK